jgi:hypothetical protein
MGWFGKRHHRDAAATLISDAPALESLDAAALRAQVRSRLLADLDDVVDLSYARPFAPGLVEALCIDFPNSVATVGAEALCRLALPVDELFEAGRRNTDAEPIEEHGLLAEGARFLTGGSLFIASKAANFGALVPAVIGEAPLGVVFGVPNRELLVYAVLSGPESVQPVNALLHFVDEYTHDSSRLNPGGVLSTELYHWAPDRHVERIGGRGHDGQTLVIEARGAFAAALGAA